MELRQRRSHLFIKAHTESPSAAAAAHENSSMAADPVTPRTEAGEEKQHESLEEENLRLRHELIDMKKVVQRYEDKTPSTCRRKESRLVMASSPRSAKRSPPPPLPSLREAADTRHHQKMSPTNSNRRQSPREIDTGKTPTGLHHRKYPTTPQDDSEVVEDRTSSIGVSPRRTTASPQQPGVKRTMQTKFRNSSVFEPDDDDIESTKPQYAEGSSLLPNDELHHQQQEDGLVVVIADPDPDATSTTSSEQEKDVADVDANDDDMDFGRMILDRAGWLVGLLVLQSMSSFIIQRNEGLLQKHLVLVRFLTMLVGAGGNAGNQASVRVIRGLAIGTIKSDAVRPFLLNELLVGLCLSIILGVAGCLRAAVFMTPFAETFAITASLFMIVMISVILGATLPLGMKMVGIDPAHSSTTIQVLMDILGVTITVSVSALVFDSSIGTWWSSKNTGTV